MFDHERTFKTCGTIKKTLEGNFRLLRYPTRLLRKKIKTA